MFKCNTAAVKLAGAVSLTVLLAFPHSGYGDFFLPNTDSCGDLFLKRSETQVTTTAIGLNTAFSGYGQGEEYFAVAVPEAGILSVELTVPGSGPVEPKLALADLSCRSSEGPSYEILSRSVSQLLAAIREPGTLYFRGAAQDPATPLGAFKLTTGFAVVSLEPEELPLKEDPDPEVIEIEPEQELFDVDTDARLPNRLRELCRIVETDDHSDRFLCATEVRPGQNVAGKLSHRRADDDDLFHLELPITSKAAIWTVILETSGDADTFGSLYDCDGLRLAADDDSGSGANFRIVKALLPGFYFIRVEGRSGSYTLNVSASVW